MRAATSIVALLCGVSLAYPGSVGPRRALDGRSEQSAADNCVESSRSPSYWRIDDLVLKVYNWDNGGSMGTFGFRSYYSATNQTVECMAQDVDLAKLGDGPWSKCNTAGTEFRFDLVDMSLTMKETWRCPASPGTIYNANATGHFMLHGCLDNDTARGLESDCNLMELDLAANATSSAATS